jgi:hypothetical protein
MSSDRHRRWVARNARRGVAALALVVAAASHPAAAAPCSAHSGTGTVALVELYTSEGCSSCPPADRWLAQAFPARGDTARAIALAFHVDYWDRLGWKDRFATAAFTDRQYAAMRANGATFVYTPQVLIQGRDFPSWRTAGRSTDGAIAAANARSPRAAIALEATAQAGGLAVKAHVEVPGVADRKGAAGYVALVESALASEVKAGENAGARLVHDHVVRVLRAFPAIAATGAGKIDTLLPWPAEAGHDATVVAFVQNPGTGDVLQALALPLSSATCAIGR